MVHIQTTAQTQTRSINSQFQHWDIGHWDIGIGVLGIVYRYGVFLGGIIVSLRASRNEFKSLEALRR